LALNVAIQVYRGTKVALSTLASTGKAGVLAWTTDTNEIFVDSGSGTGIGAGNAWLKLATDIVSVNAQTGTTYTVLGSDRSKLVTTSNAGAIAVTLPQATAIGGAFPAGWSAYIENIGVGTATITPTTSTINGGATLTLATNTGVRIISDGTNYYAITGKTTIAVTGPVANNFATSNNADGSLNLAQPAFTNISGTLAQTQLPATINAGSNLTNIDCGTF
jgi:hypothetical protein